MTGGHNGYEIPTTANDIDDLHRSGFLTDIDVYFAGFMRRLDGRENRPLTLAAALLSRSAGNGHVCLDLKDLDRSALAAAVGHLPVICRGTDDWTMQLMASPVVGSPGERRPLILDDSGRLYLYRYWRYEQDLIAAIAHRADRIEWISPTLEPERAKNAVERLFPVQKNNPEADWQKVAALAALVKPFCVISGGPGTGKTHTVARILALMIELAGGEGIDIALAAPTGKAAARLGDAIRTVLKTLDCPAAVKGRIPVEAQTIHRLLNPIVGTPYFHYDSDQPLPFDIVFVDEASMIDLALLAKLAVALPAAARLVLVGDKDQLASVAAGAVLGDICDRGRPHRFSAAFCKLARRVIETSLDPCDTAPEGGMSDCIVNLVKSYRFDDSGGIGALSRAVNRGDADASLELLRTADESCISWRPVSSARELYRALGELITAGYREYLLSEDPRSALTQFERFRILCAVNRGQFGAESLNRVAEEVLHRQGLIGSDDNRSDERWYAGRPIMVTANDYELGVFNGDVGIAVPEKTGKASGPLVVYFPDLGGRVRRIAAARLSGIETVYAMTIHKSQGSEFDQVHIVLPDTDSAVLSRELIYTAVTRARSRVTIWGREDVLAKALARKIVRHSGLREALWGKDADDGEST